MKHRLVRSRSSSLHLQRGAGAQSSKRLALWLGILLVVASLYMLQRDANGSAMHAGLLSTAVPNAGASGQRDETACDANAIHETSLGLRAVDSYPFQGGGSKRYHSLAARVLTRQMYAALRPLRTRGDFDLDRALQCGIDLPHLRVGVVAGDAESYTLFAPLMDPVIAGWHSTGGAVAGGMGLSRSAWPVTKRANLEGVSQRLRVPEGWGARNGVISTRVRAARSITGFRLAPAISRGERRLLLALLSKALRRAFGASTVLTEAHSAAMDGVDAAPSAASVWHGELLNLSSMARQTAERLRAQHKLFQDPSPRTLLAASGAARDWPDARAIWLTKQGDFMVWVNEEDHIRVMAMRQGGNIRAVFGAWAEGTARLERALGELGHPVLHDRKLGFIATCPSNIGTSLRASVLVKLPQLAGTLPKLHSMLRAFTVAGAGAPQHEMGAVLLALPQTGLSLESLSEQLGLQARGSAGEHSAARSGVYDISNRARMGHTELELVQTMVDGVEQLVRLENRLARGEPLIGIARDVSRAYDQTDTRAWFAAA